MSRGHITFGVYKLIPQVLDSAAEKPQVVAYSAYNTGSHRFEWVVGPDNVDAFHASLKSFVGLADYHFFEVENRPYVRASSEAQDRMVAGDWRGYFRALGKAHLLAFKDPVWWLNTVAGVAGVAVSAAGGVSAEVTAVKQGATEAAGVMAEGGELVANAAKSSAASSPGAAQAVEASKAFIQSGAADAATVAKAIELPAGPVYTHVLNKGGLAEIVKDQQLLASEAHGVAGGVSAVRAYAGEQRVPVVQGAQVVEFTTVAKGNPRPFNGRPAMEWPMEGGSFLSIRIRKVFHGNGKVTLFGADGTKVTVPQESGLGAK